MNQPAFVFLCVVSLIGFHSETIFADEPTMEPAAVAVDYATQIKPLFAKYCTKCHDAKEQESGLRLDAAALTLKGGDRGPAVVPGKGDASLLYQVLVGKGEVSAMPAEGPKLSADEIALIKRWIDAGAKIPQEDVVDDPSAKTRDHWAFQPIRRPAVPAVKDVVGRISNPSETRADGLEIHPPTHGRWIRNAIDAFILARLERERIEPSPEADRPTLIRRLSLDLRGLPPSIEEVDEFLADDRPGAYERLVDRLLASPHYGERWGRHWLDQARYADSHGFTIDGPRSIWKYRDWVIDAINRDLPFDRFTIEQLAGDLLPNATTEQIIATGFHRNTLINQEGGTDQEQFRVESVVDRVNTTGSVFLGLTVGCAQCHQHKYDPISQREYYQLYAVFNNCDEPNIQIPSPKQTAALKQFNAEIAAAEKPLREHDAEFLKGLPDWEQRLAAQFQPSQTPAPDRIVRPTEPERGTDNPVRGSVPDTIVRPTNSERGTVNPVRGEESNDKLDASDSAASTGPWTALAPLEWKTEKGSVLDTFDDKSVFVDFSIPPNDTLIVTIDAPLTKITAVRLEALTNSSLPMNGPGRADDGNFVLSELELFAAPLPKSSPHAPREDVPRSGTAAAGTAASETTGSATAASETAPKPVRFTKAIADHSQEGYLIAHAIDGNPKTGWAIGVKSGSLNVDREAVFFPAEPITNDAGSRLTFKLHHKHTEANHLLGRFRLSVSDAAPELLDIPAAIRQILLTSAEKRTKAQQDQLIAAYQETDKARAPLAARVADLKKQRDELNKAVPTTMVLKERAQLRETHIQIRGNFLDKGAKVEPGVPAVLHDLPADVKTPTRLDFARWLVDPANPLTARVTVNRSWQQFFGIGLVETENDFGTQGSPPSHPELLDWLADEFVRQGWSLKRMHRLIVLSAAYRQSSEVRDVLLQRDPANRLLARQSRVRLEAEIIRDNCLAAGGLLTRQLGGPGVYPPQPEGIYLLTQVKKAWPESKGADRYRRGLYTYFWRSSPYPLMPTFDAPDANTACTRRNRSNTPLQALTLANDRAFVEIAQGLAERVLREAPDYDEGRLRFAFRACLAREPNERELARLTEFLEEQRTLFTSAEKEAQAAAPAGLPEEMSVVEGAAWTATARVLLNLDEFITRE